MKFLIAVGSGPWHNIDLFSWEGLVQDPWEPLWAPRNNRQKLDKTDIMRPRPTPSFISKVDTA
jgi:hypothetical protein